MNEYFVYVLKSEKTDRFYKGQTNNLDNRLIEHNSGNTNSTKNGIPWKVVYSEKFKSREEALKKEKYFKTDAGRRFLKNKLAS